jgi:hypothetical protein
MGKGRENNLERMMAKRREKDAEARERRRRELREAFIRNARRAGVPASWLAEDSEVDA